MGVFSNLFGAGRARNLVDSSVSLSSPFVDGPSIRGVLVSDLLDLELTDLPLSRESALSVPAVSRGRDLIVSAIAPLPMVAMRNGEPLKSQPPYLTRTDSGVAPDERVMRTVDSLIFHGRALWTIKRGAKQEGQKSGPILDAAWVPDTQWSVDPEGRVLIQGVPRNPDELILFVGYKEGLLNTAQRTIKGAIDVEKSWTLREKYGLPYVNFQHVNSGSASTQNDALTQDEIDALLTGYKYEREKTDGRAVGYTPPGIEAVMHEPTASAANVEARNAIRVDIASHLGIPASLLDGSVAEASLTYVTTEGNANRFWTETLPLYIAPIENALTLASPGQTEIRFERPELLTDPGAPIGASEPTTTAEEAVTDE